MNVKYGSIKPLLERNKTGPSDIYQTSTRVPAAILSSTPCVDGRVIVILMPGSFWMPKVITAIPFCSFTVPSTLKSVVENAMIEREEGVDALVAESKTRHWRSEKGSTAHRPEEMTT